MSTLKDGIGLLGEEKQFVEKCGGQSPLQKRRPEIVLNLNPKVPIFADQTPTPTRFIRNCEEVGLFQDLQNVNPFDETFRRAAEAVNNGEQPRMGLLSCAQQPDDTLHTPNVFPLLSEPQSHPTPPCNTQNPSVPITSVDIAVPKPPRNYKRRRKVAEAKKDKITDVQAPVGSETADGVNQCVIVNRNVTFKLPIPRLPPAPKVYSPSYFNVFSKHATKFLKNGKPEEGFATQSHRRLEPMTKNELMERNRLAAVKTREKKKHYMAHLETLKKKLVDRTLELEQRVLSLETENTGLKNRLSKCRCSSEGVSSQRDVCQQTGEDVGTEGRQSDHIAYHEHDYLGLPIVESCKQGSRGGFNGDSTETRELVKDAFYSTFPREQSSDSVFEPALLGLAEDNSIRRKPFKKRNIN